MVRVLAQPRAVTAAGLTPAAPPPRAGALLRVGGVVQGVGFRPFVHRLATRFGLAGWVRNGMAGVEIAVAGDAGAVDGFVTALRTEAPPLARIESLDREDWGGEGRGDFVVAASAVMADGRQPVSPDVGLCRACERELLDPSDRRYRYPFVTCTDCGPRFSVIASMPYDRERTSMGAFRQCAACLHEYSSPGDRRYHSQTNSCPVCGPRLWLEDAEGRGLCDDRARALAQAADLLRHGRIVAVRGLGGFHLTCDATDEDAVRRLRRRKHREAKPMAVMVGSAAEARQLVALGAADVELLESPERPIVVARRLGRGLLASAVAPDLDTVGIMLPTTPLHLLLLDAARRPLVMTSGNRSEEPIATGNDEARRRLRGIADAFLLHDREIVARYDDSVVRSGAAGQVMLRRARGYAPLPLALPVAAPVPLVAVGPHLKNTLTLAVGDRAYVSQHIGDLEDLESIEHFRAVLSTFRRLFRVDPTVAVRDRHPGYLSTRLAGELGLDRVIAVQHHHAHVAAVIAEHGHVGPVVGLAFDGTGHGDDGTVWGAEVLVADLTAYRRRAWLRPAPLPGGDLAVRRPWRAALGYLSCEPGAAEAFGRAFADVDPVERAVAEHQVAHGINAPLASSMGRLFDAAAAVLGVRRLSRYEGHAACELEARAGRRAGTVVPLPVIERADGWIADPLPLLVDLGRRAAVGVDTGELAASFHESVAAAAADLARRVAAAEGLRTAALCGGSFQNDRLLASVTSRLQALGLRVLVPRRLPPNDGAVSYGQAAVAAAQLAKEA